MGDTLSPGILEPLYVSAALFALNPPTINEVVHRAETAERMANTFTVVDRPYVFDGAPDVVQKFSWQMQWPTVISADYPKFAELEALPGFFDFSLWKPIVEIFSGDGTRTAFRMLRRRADTTLTPPTGSGPWTPVTTINGSVVSNPTFGTADSIGTVPITFSSAPPAGISNIRIRYTPVFMVRVVDPRRDFTTPFVESRSLSLEEI